MISKILKSVLLVGVTVTLLSFDLPKDWIKAGSKPKNYDMGVDKGAGQNGRNAATIKSTVAQIEGFGTLMQQCLPDKYLGKRVRMSGYFKSKDVVGWSSFWLRIDYPKNSKSPTSFDNMHDGKKDRAIMGTTEWKKYEIVLDVASDAENMAFGALLDGTGQIWIENLSFEIVDSSVPTTGLDGDKSSTPSEPSNLDFSK